MAERYSAEKGAEGFIKTEALVLFLATMAFFLVGSALARR